jgi:hypothetical protein
MRKRVLACALGLAGALWLVPSASADTATIGAAAPSTGVLFGGCNACVFIQSKTDAVSPSFVVPPVPAGGGPWSVTSWSALGGTGDGSAALEIWRPTGTVGEFQLMAIGPEQPFPAGVLTNHPVSIPVQPGDHLGVQTGPDTDFSGTYSAPHPGDVWIKPITPPLPTVGQTAGGPSSDFTPVGTGADGRVNVEAVVTSAPATPATPGPAPGKKKCKKKKKKHKRSAESAKKKKCKKRKKR